MLNTIPTTNGNPATATTNTPSDNTITPADTTTIDIFDLANVQGTFKSLLVAFDDISTIAGMLLRDNLPQYQQQVLLRLLQSHAFEYALLCENEHEVITKYLAGTRWGDEVGGKA